MKTISPFASIRIILSATLIVLIASSFNSQEHKIVADVGASRVVIPSTIVFPGGVSIQTSFDYLKPWQNAKMLAVGFNDNDQNKYDKWRDGVQDNCYWNNYGQLNFNRNNWIETDKSLWPSKLLNIDAIVGSKRESYSFGDLVAIYGDYRRTVFADNNADCYLTNDGTNTLNFSGNTAQKYCPPAIGTGDYLHKIGFGVCPPYGSYGNIGSNTAGDAQYGEIGWWGDEMMRIANVNETHFSSVAVAYYIGMHRMALLAAQKAVNDPNYWKMALHCEAAALHSLTDLFSIGHALTNRDESSWGAIHKNGLQTNDTWKWIEGVIKMGGGKRANNGILSLSTDFGQYGVQMSGRKDFMPSYLGDWALWGKAEHDYHDYFNGAGAKVRNFNGDLFQVYGDYKLHDLDANSRRVIENAVTASLQSLIDYADQLKKGAKPEVLNASANNPKLFAALKYIPVFVEKDPDNYFWGMWITYAPTVKAILGMGNMPAGWERCKIPFLSGKDNLWPGKQGSACSKF